MNLREHYPIQFTAYEVTKSESQIFMLAPIKKHYMRSAGRRRPDTIVSTNAIFGVMWKNLNMGLV